MVNGTSAASEDVGEPLELQLRWGDGFDSGEQELLVRSRDDVWVSVLKAADERAAEPFDGKGLQVLFGSEMIREKCGSYEDFGIEDGATLTAVVGRDPDSLVAVSPGGAGTNVVIEENDALNYKNWQLIISLGFGDHPHNKHPTHKCAADIKAMLGIN